ncbi:MAG: hypothetical protein Q9170_001599 [Blastenia crenularia]
MVASVVLPILLLLGLAGGGFLLSGDGVIFNWSSGTIGASYGDGIPVYSCGTEGYLKGYTWTFLGINLRFGRMTFSQAKTLDLIWNWVAGRGLQLFLAWLTYPVHTAALMRVAEVSHVSYDLFTALALFSTRPSSLCDLVKASVSTQGVRVRFIFTWLLLSTIYLAALPSLLDLMSGYEASTRTELVLPNKTTVDVTDFSDFRGSLFHCSDPDPDPRYSCGNANYVFYDLSLNTSYQAILTNGLDMNEFYTAKSDNYHCIAEKGMYQWGFSGEWVLLISCFNGAWIIGLWILWVDTEWNSQFTRKGRRMDTYRAIADIAEAMKGDLGEDTCAYSEKELAAALKRGGPIKYYVEPDAEGEKGHIGLSSRQSKRAKLEWDKKYG